MIDQPTILYGAMRDLQMYILGVITGLALAVMFAQIVPIIFRAPKEKRKNDQPLNTADASLIEVAQSDPIYVDNKLRQIVMDHFTPFCPSCGDTTDEHFCCLSCGYQMTYDQVVGAYDYHMIEMNNDRNPDIDAFWDQPQI